MKQRLYRTQYNIPSSGEAWNSDVGAKANNDSPDTVLSPDDPYYELAMGRVKKVEEHD